MIISVPYKPTWLGSAYNPIIWSVLSSKVASIDFKYVFEIYIDDVKVNTIKQRANANGYGMIDVSNMVRGYIESTSLQAKITQGETSIDYNDAQFYSDNNLMSRKVYLKVGEEYTENGVTQTYIGTADTPGVPAYFLYSGNTTTPNTAVHAWASSLTDHEQQWNMQKTNVSGIWGDNPFDDNKCYDHGINLAYPLMKASITQDVYEIDKIVLSFLNWSPNVVLANQRTIFGFRYKIYDNVGDLQTFDIPMITANGFDQRALCSSLVSTIASKNMIVNVLAGPNNIIEATNYSTTNWPVRKIEIQGFNQDVGCEYGDAITQLITLNVKEQCPDPLYRRVRLSFFNELGGRDYINANMFVEKNIAVTQETYSQEQMNWGLSTPVPMLNDSLPIQNLGIKGGTKAFNKQSQTTYKLLTDWLLQPEIDLIEGLIKSPQVMCYIDNGTTISTEYPYTCTVVNSSYAVKNVRQVKLVQAELEIKLFTKQQMQNL